MSEYDLVEFCEECEANSIFTFSGSGKKGVCECGHLLVTISKVSKSFRRLEDSWGRIKMDWILIMIICGFLGVIIELRRMNKRKEEY